MFWITKSKHVTLHILAFHVFSKLKCISIILLWHFSEVGERHLITDYFTTVMSLTSSIKGAIIFPTKCLSFIVIITVTFSVYYTINKYCNRLSFSFSFTHFCSTQHDLTIFRKCFLSYAVTYLSQYIMDEL